MLRFGLNFGFGLVPIQGAQGFDFFDEFADFGGKDRAFGSAGPYFFLVCVMNVFSALAWTRMRMPSSKGEPA